MLPASITEEELQTKLTAQFPQYKVKKRAKNFLIVGKTATVGTNVMLRKDKILVAASFPNIGASIIFAVCVVVLGVVLPLIIYLSVFLGPQKKVEKEVSDFLKTFIKAPEGKK